MELSAALAEKRDSWKPSDLKSIQDLLKKKAAEGFDALKGDAQGRMVAAGELEKEEYELMKKMMEPLGD